MRRWHGFMAVWLTGMSSLMAHTNVLFSADFERERSLQGWVCSLATGDTPPDTAFGVVASETANGKTNYFFRARNHTFGVSVLLDHPCRVNSATRTVEVLARVRCNGKANPVRLDLSSRESPTFPFQFSEGRGVGFGAAGYQHANEANGIYHYRDTKNPTSYTEKRPLVTNESDWHSWRLVYDHPAATLALYVNGAAEPLLTQKGVQLEGARFQSLFFMGSHPGADYDDVCVRVVEARPLENGR